MSIHRRTRSRTGGAETSRRAHGDAQARAASLAASPPDDDTVTTVPPDQAVSGQCAAAPPTDEPRTDPVGSVGTVGPTSEATRRLVAEGRSRQGLSPNIDNPAVIESLALFLRHALSSLDQDSRADDGV